MKISVEKEVLLQAISKVGNIVNPKVNLPILSNILIESSGSKTKIIATDLDIGIKTQISTTVQEPGAITIPAKRFFEIIRRTFRAGKTQINNELFSLWFYTFFLMKRFVYTLFTLKILLYN